MPTRFAVVGPGRVGTALARRWGEAGFALLGFHGRDPARTRAAIEFCGAGRPLADLGALREATVVLLAVADRALREVVAAAVAAGAARRCSLWLHTSGSHDLAPLEPLQAAGARIGSLHPLCPFPDAATGYRDLVGKPAVLQGGSRSMRLLQVLARRAGMRPLRMRAGDRARYHAACALAANGLTALFDVATELFAEACEVEDDRAGAGEPPAIALMRAALAACVRDGAARALTGPVQRGDVDTVRAHLRTLDGRPAAAGVYRALMRHALELALRAGAPGAREQRAALTELLDRADG